MISDATVAEHVKTASDLGLSCWPLIKVAKQSNEWVERLGELDTKTYPWQLALYDEFLGPFKVGDCVRFHVDKLRHNFPWEEIDKETSVVREVVNYHHRNGGTCYIVERNTDTPFRSKHHKIRNSEYLPILEYFFGKGTL